MPPTQPFPSSTLASFTNFVENLESLTDGELEWIISKSKCLNVTMRKLLTVYARYNYDSQNDEFFENFDKEFAKMEIVIIFRICYVQSVREKMFACFRFEFTPFLKRKVINQKNRMVL